MGLAWCCSGMFSIKVMQTYQKFDVICKIFFFLCFVRSFETHHACGKFILSPNGLGNIHFRTLMLLYQTWWTWHSFLRGHSDSFYILPELPIVLSWLNNLRREAYADLCMLSQLWPLTVVSSYVPLPCCAQGLCISHSSPLALTVFTTLFQHLFLWLVGTVIQMSI